MRRVGICPILAIVLLAQVTRAGAQLATLAKVDTRDDALWAANVAPYLAKPLWQNAGRYDATHFLMVPLHAAFSLHNSDWQHEFFDHFNTFLSSNPPSTFPARDELSWLQYDYLASQFLILAAASHAPVPAGLPDFLGKQIQNIWIVRPAVQWDHASFNGMKARVAWKLAVREVQKSYYRAIIDNEQYVFAIAADLSSFDRMTDTRHSWSTTVDDILNVAAAVYAQRVIWQADGRWLFQPGVWADHPDFLYAGQPGKVAGMKPSPVLTIAF